VVDLTKKWFGHPCFSLTYPVTPTSPLLPILTAVEVSQVRTVMHRLLGQTFSVGEGEYRVVDVRQLSGEVMVYAEETGHGPEVGERRKPRKAAFHYGDIASRLRLDDAPAA
jgi:hypothetical protein